MPLDRVTSALVSAVGAGTLAILSTAEAAAPQGTASLVYQGAEAPAQASHTPTSVVGTKEERVAKATANYAQNRAVEAALGFEGLWKDYPTELDFLFNAAASRAAAGHFAHAVTYTREYLAAGPVRPEDRVEADAQLREALAHTAPLAVTVVVESGEPAGALVLVAEHVARDSADIRPELQFRTKPGQSNEIQLDPGLWTVRAQGPGHLPTEQRVDVRKGENAKITLRLRPIPVESAPSAKDRANSRPEVPSSTVRGLKLGFGIGGGVFAVAGIAVSVAGGVGVSRQSRCAEGSAAGGCSGEDFGPNANGLARALTMRDTGLMGLGGGLGLLTGSLTWLVKDPGRRNKVWTAEAVVGGASLIVGAVLVHVTARNFNERNDANVLSDWYTHYQDSKALGGHAVSSALAGFGIGALSSALTGLAVQRKHLGRMRVQAGFSGRHAGLTLFGRF